MGKQKSETQHKEWWGSLSHTRTLTLSLSLSLSHSSHPGPGGGGGGGGVSQDTVGTSGLGVSQLNGGG